MTKKNKHVIETFYQKLFWVNCWSGTCRVFSAEDTEIWRHVAVSQLSEWDKLTCYQSPCPACFVQHVLALQYSHPQHMISDSALNSRVTGQCTYCPEVSAGPSVYNKKQWYSLCMSHSIQLITASSRSQTPYSKQSIPIAQPLFPPEGLIQYFLLLTQPSACKNECSDILQVCTRNSVSQVDYMWIKNWWAKNKELSRVLSSTGKWERWHRECGKTKASNKKMKNIHLFF